MRIVVINLDRDIARMEHMRAQLDRLGLAYERFAALRGDALPADLRGYFAADAPLSNGEIGCYASHLAIMRRVADGDWTGPVLVLEDDVGLPQQLPRMLNTLLQALPSRWDIVRLSYPSKRVMRRIASMGSHELVRYSHVPVSTGAYIISSSGARKFLANTCRDLPIDQDLRRVWAWDLDTYGVSPPLIRADVLGSSTIDALSPKVRDPKARRVARRLQRSREGAARFVRGVRDFGIARWVCAEALNIAARLTPKRVRPALFDWAKARLA